MSYISAGLFFIETWLFSFYVQEIPRKSPNVCHSSNLPSILQISYLVYSFQVNYKFNFKEFGDRVVSDGNERHWN